MITQSTGIPWCMALHFIKLWRYYIKKKKMKVCGNSVWSESIGRIFPTAFDHFCVPVSHLGNSYNVSNFHYCICHGYLWLVTFITWWQSELRGWARVPEGTWHMCRAQKSPWKAQVTYPSTGPLSSKRWDVKFLCICFCIWSIKQISLSFNKIPFCKKINK